METYDRVRDSYPDFRFEELVDRVLGGEDVLELEEGSLMPLAIHTDWAVRIEYNSLTLSELKKILQGVDTSAKITVRSPSVSLQVSQSKTIKARLHAAFDRLKCIT